MARDIAGFSFIVNSGCRCEKHNKDEGSTSTNHTSGKAADIRCADGWAKYKMVAALISAGILGIGIRPTFIHGDTNREIPALWTY